MQASCAQGPMHLSLAQREPVKPPPDLPISPEHPQPQPHSSCELRSATVLRFPILVHCIPRSYELCRSAPPIKDPHTSVRPLLAQYGSLSDPVVASVALFGTEVGSRPWPCSTHA